jgi:hypothetical protein
VQDIWSLAKVHKGCPTNTFPPLCDTDNMLVDNLTCKAQIFQQCFFLEAPPSVQPIQEDDPPPCPTHTWTPITPEDVTTTLSTALDSSAPGPSSIGYRILKWVHSVCPDLLTCIYNRSIDTGVHPWKHAMVVILNKPNKPDYSLAKAYHPISLLECIAKLLEKIVAKRVNADIISTDLLPMSQFGS